MVHAEIEARRKADEMHAPYVPLFTARVTAVFDAAEASTNGEEGGEEGLRQSLIDLAACAEAMASQLPPPDQWREITEDAEVMRQRRAVAEAATPVRVKWTPELIIGAMHRFVDLHGRLPTTDDWRKGGDGHPTAQTVSNQFGTWRAALRAAGYGVDRTEEKAAA